MSFTNRVSVINPVTILCVVYFTSLLASLEMNDRMDSSVVAKYIIDNFRKSHHETHEYSEPRHFANALW